MLVVCILASALGALVMCLLVLRFGFAPVAGTDAERDQQLVVTRLGHATAGVCFAVTAVLAAVILARPPAAPPVAAPHPAVLQRLAALERDQGTLREEATSLHDQVGGEMHSVRERLERTESRVAGVEAGVKRLGEDVAQASARARQIERAPAARPVSAAPRAAVTPPVARVPAPVREAPAPEADRVIPPAESALPTAVEPPVPAKAARAAPVSAPPTTPAPPAAAPPAPTAAAPAPAPMSLTEKVRHDWETIRRGFERAGDDIASAMRNVGRRVGGQRD